MQRGEGNRIFMANFIDFNFANDKHFFARIPSWVPVATFDCCSVIRRMLRHVNSLFLPPSLSVCCMLMRAFLSAITISSSGVRGPQRTIASLGALNKVNINKWPETCYNAVWSVAWTLHGFTFFSPSFCHNLRGWATSIRQSHIDQLSSTIY